MELDS
jgi:hypothetical protein